MSKDILLKVSRSIDRGHELMHQRVNNNISQLLESLEHLRVIYRDTELALQEALEALRQREAEIEELKKENFKLKEEIAEKKSKE